MDSFSGIISGFEVVFQTSNLLYCLIGVVIAIWSTVLLVLLRFVQGLGRRRVGRCRADGHRARPEEETTR